MGDSLKAIHDDIEAYEALCRQYNEVPKRANDGFADCYGEHARELKERARKDYEKQRLDTLNRQPEYYELKELMFELLARIEKRKLSSLVNSDPELVKWWKKYKKEYTDYFAERERIEKRNKEFIDARKKLTPRERGLL